MKIPENVSITQSANSNRVVLAFVVRIPVDTNNIPYRLSIEQVKKIKDMSFNEGKSIGKIIAQIIKEKLENTIIPR
jgi:hypothetical protein